MKITKLPDGRAILDGTPEELAEHERRLQVTEQVVELVKTPPVAPDPPAVPAAATNDASAVWVYIDEIYRTKGTIPTREMIQEVFPRVKLPDILGALATVGLASKATGVTEQGKVAAWIKKKEALGLSVLFDNPYLNLGEETEQDLQEAAKYFVNEGAAKMASLPALVVENLAAALVKRLHSKKDLYTAPSTFMLLEGLRIRNPKYPKEALASTLGMPSSVMSIHLTVGEIVIRYPDARKVRRYWTGSLTHLALYKARSEFELELTKTRHKKRARKRAAWLGEFPLTKYHPHARLPFLIASCMRHLEPELGKSIPLDKVVEVIAADLGESVASVSHSVHTTASQMGSEGILRSMHEPQEKAIYELAVDSIPLHLTHNGGGRQELRETYEARINILPWDTMLNIWRSARQLAKETAPSLSWDEKVELAKEWAVEE